MCGNKGMKGIIGVSCDNITVFKKLYISLYNFLWINSRLFRKIFDPFK